MKPAVVVTRSLRAVAGRPQIPLATSRSRMPSSRVPDVGRRAAPGGARAGPSARTGGARKHSSSLGIDPSPRSRERRRDPLYLGA
jgi:hypothetical protein